MLEKLFTSKNRVKILGHLFFEKPKSRIREISRELKMPVSGVKKEIDNLLVLNIISKNKQGIKLNKNSLVENLKNIFIKSDYLVYPLQKSLDSKKIIFALIFGSFAKGNYNFESDVDLLIIGEIKISETLKIIKPIEKEIGKSINPVVWNIENLKKEKKSGFIKDIFKKKIIMIKGDENEIRRIIK